jgi:hypothetical protein
MIVCAALVTGLVTVLVFGYASDQKAIHRAKDLLKAHLLALRLFQDQIPVVLRSYGLILLATGRYLRLALLPVLYTALPLTLLLAQMDRYFADLPLQPGQTFLLKAKVADAATLSDISLTLPAGIESSASAVHIPEEDTVVWRLMALRNGSYDVNIHTPLQTFTKQVVVAEGLARLSPARLRAPWWQRLFLSAEPALPGNAQVNSIEVQYPERTIPFAGYAWNWVWLLFALSLPAGFAFKSILGIEI